MSEVIKDSRVKETEKKRFTINIDSGNGNIFTFSGPEKSSLGLIYDASHRIMMEVISILHKRADDLKTKNPEDITSVNKENAEKKDNDLASSSVESK